MGFIDLAKKRYSCRKFDPYRPVEDDKLKMVLEAGRIAPSAVNYQPWKFIVIREPGNLERIKGAYHRNWFKSAPCVIAICGDHQQSWKRGSDGKDHCDIDVAIAVDHLALAAADHGLGTCWVCNFDKTKCAETLQLPEQMEPIVLLPIGYPLDSVDINRHEQKRKPWNEVVVYEKYE